MLFIKENLMQPTIFDESQKTKQSDAVVITIRPYKEALPLSLQVSRGLINDDDIYPTGKIVKKYLLVGGCISGVIMMPLITMQSKDFDLKIMLAGLPITFIFVLLSTTLAGFLIASFKLHLNAKGLLWSAIIGAGITFKTFSTMEFTTSILIILILIGAVSAMLTGLIALPKSNIRDRKNDII